MKKRLLLVLLLMHTYNSIHALDNTKIALYGPPPETGLLSLSESEIRSQAPTWFPGLVSQSVLLWNKVNLEMK